MGDPVRLSSRLGNVCTSGNYCNLPQSLRTPTIHDLKVEALKKTEKDVLYTVGKKEGSYLD